MTNREVINNLKDEQLAYFIVVTSEKIFRCYTSSTGGLVGWLSREANRQEWLYLTGGIDVFDKYNFISESKELDLTDVPKIERKDYIKIKSKSVFEEGADDKNE